MLFVCTPQATSHVLDDCTQTNPEMTQMDGENSHFSGLQVLLMPYGSSQGMYLPTS